MQHAVYTIGHSTHPREFFVALLLRHGIGAVGDVRSKPYSRMHPQFNREELTNYLYEAGIAYVFLGRELGGRGEDRSCYDSGKVRYERLAQTQLFREGLRRVREGTRDRKMALMCAEKDPLDCHRGVLVARHLPRMDPRYNTFMVTANSRATLAQ